MQHNAMILHSLLILILISVNYVNSTHFQGGSITYKVVNVSGSNVTIVLTQTYIYDYASISCTDSMIANQSPKLSFPSPYSESSKYVDCIQYCNQSGGYVAPSVVSYCTDYSIAFSITVGQRSDTLQIKNGSYFRIAFQSSAWRALTLPADSISSKSWSISCLINLQMRSNGQYNTPPIATIISPINIPVGIQQAIYIPTIDGDNDQVRCRFSNGTNECYNTCPPGSLPNGTILLSNCTLLITGKNVNDWYAVTIQIEDFLDSNSITPISSIPVQFLINVKSVPSCSTPPLLTSANSSQTTSDCVGIQVGQTYTVQLIAQSFCGTSVTIKDIATLSFPIVVKTPIVRNTTTTWSITLKWTPTASSVGSQILCAVAIDSNNVQSNQYCMKFTVAQGTIPTCPGETTTTTTTTTTTQITTETTTIETTSTTTEITMITITTTTTEITTTTTEETTTVASTMIQSVNSTNSFSTNQNKKNTKTSSVSFDAWVAAVLSILGILLLALCCCCWLRICLWCIGKSKRNRTSRNQNIDESNSMYFSTYTNMTHDTITEDIFTARPASATSIKNIDDIQVNNLSTPRINKPLPHYALPLQRTPKISPLIAKSNFR